AWRSRELSFEDDVVDQAGCADANCGGQDLRVAEVDDLDVVGLKAVQRCTCDSGRISRADGGTQRAWQTERALAFLGGQSYVARRQCKAVVVPHGRQHANFDADVQVADDTSQ